MIDIQSKSDIIIPFEKIGDRGWKEKTALILQEYANVWGNKLEIPVSVDAITALEKRLGTRLPVHLKLFYQQFGVADIGEELQSFDTIGWLRDIWKAQPQYAPNFTEKEKKYLPFLVSFSDYLGNGNLFCFHSETKEIYYFDHDTEPFLTKIFTDASDYIKGCLISCQMELSVNKNAERWCEEVLIELFDRQTVRKWRY